MARGGKRLGAGRKPGLASIIAERVRDKIAVKVEEEFEEIVKPQIEKAKNGDTTAFNSLMDRGFGRAKESISVTETDTEEFEITDEQLTQLIRARTTRTDNKEGSN